jgi:CRP-like cAMP-binding protein
VIAERDTEVVVVAKQDFAAVLNADSGIVDALSTALEERVRHQSAHAAADLERALTRQTPQRAALISRIRGFFGVK